jgi:hypothetical protein
MPALKKELGVGKAALANHIVSMIEWMQSNKH